MKTGDLHIGAKDPSVVLREQMRKGQKVNRRTYWNQTCLGQEGAIRVTFTFSLCIFNKTLDNRGNGGKVYSRSPLHGKTRVPSRDCLPNPALEQ